MPNVSRGGGNEVAKKHECTGNNCRTGSVVSPNDLQERLTLTRRNSPSQYPLGWEVPN